MAGQAALMSRDEVRSKIKSVEKNCGSSSSKPIKMGKEDMKTSKKK